MSSNVTPLPTSRSAPRSVEPPPLSLEEIRAPVRADLASVDTMIRARLKSRVPLVDQVGKDTLPQLLALMSRATALLTPDSGPAHMATMVNLPVIGLYAATNPQRSGPYLSRQWCVDAYDEAARTYLKKSAAELPWTRKIELPGVMELISVPAVTTKLDELMATRLSTPRQREKRQ